MTKLSIIMPVYNESKHITAIIERILKVSLPETVERELIVVDDGSSDGTSQLLKKYKDQGAVIIHSSRINFGKGTAIRIGLTYATGNIILIQDGDLEYDPNDYTKLIEPILQKKAKVVYGSRFRGEKIKGMRTANYIANIILRLATNILFGAAITDEATGYKVFAREVFEGVQLKARKFEFCPEITAKVLKAGYKIYEIPINYHPRSLIEGKKITWRDGFSAIWTLIKYRFVD